MSQTIDEIIAAALSLPAQTKVKLAEQLLDSVEASNQAHMDELWDIEIRRRLQDLDEAWAKKAERRLDEYEAGHIQTISAEQVLRPRDSREKA